MTLNVAREAAAMSLTAVASWLIICSQIRASERMELEVREVGGFKRNEPVSTLFTLPQAVPRDTPFRLLLDGTPVIAQFRPVSDARQVTQWWLDFSSSLSPHEDRTYVVEYGSDVQPVAEPANGHVLRQTQDSFVIENAPYITWTAPRDLKGLVRSVDFPPNEHLRPESPGLVLKDRSGEQHVLGGPGVEASVVRSGSRAVAFRFAGMFNRGSLADVKWTVDLIFPSPVSWVEVICTVNDPQEKVSALGTGLDMALDPPKPDAPTLVDIGAWTLVYTSLAQNELVELRAVMKPSATAAGRCEVFRGRPESLVPLANNEVDSSDISKTKSAMLAPEGWLHVMDRKRCLALAVDRFAQDADERLTISADGKVRVWREYSTSANARPAPAKSLRCWLHFVHFPPQYSAATSPRMMQTPSIVRVKN
jgi:hypothetical protein